MSWLSKTMRKVKRWLRKPSRNQIYREARKARDELADILEEVISHELDNALSRLEVLLKEH